MIAIMNECNEWVRFYNKVPESLATLRNLALNNISCLFIFSLMECVRAIVSLNLMWSRGDVTLLGPKFHSLSAKKAALPKFLNLVRLSWTEGPTVASS